LVFGIVDEEVVEQIGDDHAGKEPHGIISDNHKMTDIGCCAERIETVSRIKYAQYSTKGKVMEVKEQ
jgi:hypothetical protein